MTNIDLNKPSNLPGRFIARLNQLDGVFQLNDSYDSLFNDPAVKALVQEIDDYCRQHRIVGVHYTRADRSSIESQGLLIRSGAEIRAAFLADHGNRFSEAERQELENNWQRYYIFEQSHHRDNCICLNFTEKALTDGGAEPLLRHYGGEQVYMGLDNKGPLRCKLKNIGNPMIIRCSLAPAAIQTFTENPFGKTLVSSYHCSINYDAIQFDQDARLNIPVPASDILEIRDWIQP